MNVTLHDCCDECEGVLGVRQLLQVSKTIQCQLIIISYVSHVREGGVNFGELLHAAIAYREIL